MVGIGCFILYIRQLMKLSKIIIEPWSRVFGIPIMTLFIAIFSKDEPLSWVVYFTTLVFVLILWNGDYAIIMKFRKVWPDLDDTHKRIVTTIMVVCVFNIALDFIICDIFEYFNHPNFGYDSNHTLTDILSRNLGATLIVGTLYEAGYFFQKWKVQTIEIERVKSQQLRSELSTLKNQVSPHFLFNSLNTLVALINENPKQAIRFTEHLSHGYRYILQNREKEIVDLKCELEFTQGFCFLMQIRFEDSIKLNIDVDDRYKKFYTAPLTLQMLVENAVKHNVVSNARPLQIDIFIENEKYIVVRNILQRKTEGVKSLKTGLENIKQRYMHLSNETVVIEESAEYFKVALPLIELSNEIETSEP